MLLCAGLRERDRDGKARDGDGGCTQRFVASSAASVKTTVLLDAVSDVGCSPNGFFMRHLHSQHAISLSGTQWRYFTIVEETNGRTWLTWKDHVIDGNLLVAPLEGADASEPKLELADNQTLLTLRFIKANVSFYLTHNTALLIRDDTLHLVGGRSRDHRENAVYTTSIDASLLAASAALKGRVPWAMPKRIFDGRQPGCVDGRSNRHLIAPYVSHGVCEFDGRLSMTFFQGRYLTYIRSNPTLGRRFVQLTRSVNLTGPWSPLRSIRLRGVDACSVSIYTFSVQVHPLRADRLIAFFPVVLGCRTVPNGAPEGPENAWASGVMCESTARRFELHGAPESNRTSVHDLRRLGNNSLMMACSADGQSWSRPFQLFTCRSRGGIRTASLPVANGLRFAHGRLFVWVHQDVPTGQTREMTKREMRRSKLVRYELDGAAFRKWSAEACGEGLTATAAEAAEEEELRALPFNSSRLMRSVARLWYDNGGKQDENASTSATAMKELRSTSHGWCGSRIPRAPWSRGSQDQDHQRETRADPDAVNDDFFFETSWLGGFPYSLARRAEAHHGLGLAVCKRKVEWNEEGTCRKRNDTHVCCRQVLAEKAVVQQS